MREVFRYLKQHAKPNPNKPKGKGKPCDDGEKSDDGQGQNSTPSPEGTQDSDDWDTVEVNGKVYDISQSDEHDFKDVDGDEAKEISENIDKALREGGILAGRMGGNIPRHINELLKPIVDWREELREFVTSSMSGKDEFTWRKMNKRHLANDIYLPSVEAEAIGEIVVGIDTSGSIGSEELTEFATELASICGLVQPESVRILWWDTMVHGEQIFKPDEYNNLASLLKPLGGGGTHVSCVSNYIKKKDIKAECVLIFTDGYVEHDITWDITIPTLWMVTMNESFVPPCGRKVIFNND
jgi:predicted metal-dependent peptidase